MKNNPMIKTKRFVMAGSLAACLAAMIGVGAAQYFDMEYFPITAVKATASSTLVEKGRAGTFYSPEKALDNVTATAWCAASGRSGGEYIEAFFEPRAFSGLALLNGCGGSKKLYFENNRVKEYALTLFLKNGDKILKKGTLSAKSCTDEHPAVPNRSGHCYLEYNVGGEHIDFGKPLCLRGFRLGIVSVYRGSKFNDTCIAEIKRLSYRDSAEADFDSEDIRKKAAVEAGACD
ncbi:MAG: hypothetical protein KA369_22590 [Spirochaetes bacterium]|nr:hypothetical protein [Spirochaetota bacterium]